MKRLPAVLIGVLAALSLLAPPASPSPPDPRTRPDLDTPAVPGEYVVRFRPGTPQHERVNAVAAHGGRFFDRIESLDTDAVEFPALRRGSRSAAERVVDALKRNPNVELVEPNFLYRADFTPNDPALGQQWAWDTIRAYSAWDVTRGGPSTVIAVVDTGIQRNHPDLDAKIVPGYDFVQGDTSPDDGHGHGTHVAGTAAAETDNATGGAGTCPDCAVMPVRVLNDSGSGTLVAVANGINYAANTGAKSINLSLGGTGSSTLEAAVNYAWNKGSFLACAAGNSSTSSTSSAYPAAYPNCFAVASTTSTDARSSFSNYGSWVEVAAPGSSIYSTWIGSSYRTISGTSMATPHVAGVAGLLASQGLTNQQVRDRICDSADDISGTGVYWTCGRISSYRAVTGGSPQPPPPPPPSGEAVTNGGFEQGTSPWVQSSSGGYQLITTNRPHAGSYSAWLGGYNNGADAIYQTITVPADGTLTYWWYLSSSEGSTTAYDFLRVRLFSTTGQLLATLRTKSNTSPRNAWYQDSLGLAAHAGQTLRLHFSVTTDLSLPTSFFIDDVSVR